ncbi:MAG: hypothetical protein WC736_15370 [Gallionella sp.]
MKRYAAEPKPATVKTCDECGAPAGSKLTVSPRALCPDCVQRMTVTGAGM